MAFDSLPIELNEHIACYLPTDRDVVNFMLICQATRATTESYRCGLWRSLFARKFDMPRGKTGQELKLLYKLRSRALRKHVNWRMGHESTEARVLAILQDLIVDSYAHMPLGQRAVTQSKNTAILRDYVKRSNILDKVLSCLHRDERIFNPALKTLQLVLTHFSFDTSLRLPTLGFEYSQKAVYAHPTKQPLFQGRTFNKVNIDLLMHTANFFKFHLTTLEAQTLYNLYSELESHERPQAWNTRLDQGATRLGKHWRGSYAYLHDLNDVHYIRSTAPGSMLFTDTIDFHDGFQTLGLDFSPASNMTPWPKVFESHLKAMPPVSLCNKLDKLRKSQKPHPKPASNLPLPRGIKRKMPPGAIEITPQDPLPTSEKLSSSSEPGTPPLKSPRRGVHYNQFSGSGRDADPFSCSGILHPLPPQHGIPGWHRISMIKYFDPTAAKNFQALSVLSNGPSTPDYASSSGTTSHSSPFSPHSPHSSASSTSSVSDHAFDPFPTSTFTPINAYPTASVPSNVDVNDECWAYEGVVLPGGKIMLGRWWSPTQDADELLCMGPFIFWEVDEEP